MSRIHLSRIPAWTKASSLALRLALFAGVAVCALHAGPVWAGVIYVRGDAAGTNNGLSWADAYTNLQAALAAAVSEDEIWVAQGTYKPTTGTLRTVYFRLKEGVGLYGGFAGAETERGQRNWEANTTTLSGDIGTPSDAEDNSYRVVIGASLAVLDGFTITGANNELDNYGGGMHNGDYNSGLTVTNCTFSGNTAGRGGGMYNGSYCSPTVTNCTFSGNTAISGSGMDGGNGGGMYNLNSSPTVTNCTFSGNTATDGGGGMSTTTPYYPGGSPTVTNCTFSGNTAGNGGGVNGNGVFTNCTFSGNTASHWGGRMCNWDRYPTVTNCTFSGNTAGGGGGGMCNGLNGWPSVTNSIFWENVSPVGAEIVNENTTHHAFRNCDIKGSGGSGALWDPLLGADDGGNIEANPRFMAPATPAGPDALWRTRDDGLRLRPDSPCIGAADPVVAPLTDILGLTRKTAPDIGAYEFGRTRTSADPAWLLFR